MSIDRYEFAAALIVVFEGERLRAYQDSGGVWTIAFGHTRGGHAGMSCTHADGVGWFQEDAAAVCAYRASAAHSGGRAGELQL